MTATRKRSNTTSPAYDVVIIGGGFFGCVLGLLFRSVTDRVLILERGEALMERASAVNQARVHTGLHYPRSFATARRSLRDLPLFINAFEDCIQTDFRMLYAVARQNSRVSASRFETMFKDMGAAIEQASPSDRALFDADLIEAVFRCDEYAFDWKKIRENLSARLSANDVPVRFRVTADRVDRLEDGTLELSLENGETLTSKAVFNVTYAELNRLPSKSACKLYPLKHEHAEIALITPPTDLQGRAVTVMDGPFFSAMPFPAENLYSLTHVRYTPHAAWTDTADAPLPYETAAGLPKMTRWRHMARDAARYMPCMAEAAYERSLFDVKTVPLKNEHDDGRPILFHEQPDIPGFFTVLGGKLDNIFDLIDHLPTVRPEWAALSASLLVDR